MADTIQLRRATAANWTATNPVLAEGEKGIEKDTGKEKTGDGVTTWNDLPYFGGANGTGIPEPASDGDFVRRKSGATFSWVTASSGGGAFDGYTKTESDGKYQLKGTYLTDAPADGKNYGRTNNAWTEVVSSGGSDTNIGNTNLTITSARTLTQNTSYTHVTAGNSYKITGLINSITPKKAMVLNSDKEVMEMEIVDFAPTYSGSLNLSQTQLLTDYPNAKFVDAPNTTPAKVYYKRGNTWVILGVTELA